jgi:hypothetical protein
MLDHLTIDISVSGYRYFEKNQNEKLHTEKQFLPEFALWNKILICNKCFKSSETDG